MDTTQMQQVLDKMGLVYNLAEKCKLEDAFFDLVDTELEFLVNYFRITKPQAVFISVIFALNYTGQKVDMGDLNRFFSSNPMKLLKFRNDFLDLHERGLLRKSRSRFHSLQLTGTSEKFHINDIVVKCIFNNEPIPEVLTDPEVFDDVFKLLKHINKLVFHKGAEESSTKELFEIVKNLIENHNHIPLIDRLQSMMASHEEKVTFLYIIWKFLEGHEYVMVEKIYKDIYDDVYDQFTQIHMFIAQENNLVKEGWLVVKESHFFGDALIELTDKTKEMLEECGIKLYYKEAKNDSIILPDSITFKELVFNENEKRQFELLKNLLKEENLKTTQDRLLQKALPKGVAVLLHGAPGTGKTEMVKQIAKATNRRIMKVDISQTKSMWFGDSERIIKRIFSDYNNYVKKCKQYPILFFNEADAVIGKRKEVGNSGVGQTENTIQNILLEEIENFEGILIATTNLTNNLDSAFERRFLFKVEFQKPGLAAKAQIWKSKMPYLSKEECELLASKFDFSGGQIDNIVRKNEINEILYGKKVDVTELVEYCKEEILKTKRSLKPVGFKTNNPIEVKEVELKLYKKDA